MDEKKNYSGSRKKTMPMMISCSMIFLLVGMALASTPIGNGVSKLDDLIDCNVPTPNDNDVLTYDTATSNWTAETPTGGATVLDDLTDVDTTGVSDNDFLQYNGTHWVDFDLFNSINTWLLTNTFNGRVNLLGVTSMGDCVSNYIEINENGILRLHGDAIVKQHVGVPAPLWVKGAVEPADDIIGITPVLSFDKDRDEAIHYSLIIPFRMIESSTIGVTVNWCHFGFLDSGTVQWKLSYYSMTTGEYVDGIYTNMVKRSTGNHPIREMVTTSFDASIIGAVANDVLALMLIRDVRQDTLETDAHLIGVYFEFYEDKLGESV